MSQYLQNYLRFWSFQDPTTVWVVIGSMALGLICALLGTFAFLRRQALIGDALSHAALPGVTTFFILFQTRNPLVILLGAMSSCAIGMLCLHLINRFSKIKQDSGLAIVLSTFFAIGIFQLTFIQKSGSGSQSGLDRLLFGQAASLVYDDVRLLATIAAIVLVIVVVLFERFKLVAFDRNLAASLGIHSNFYEAVLSVLLVVSIAVGLQLAGIVLMAALLLTPAAAARYWSDRLSVMLLIASFFGALSGLLGASLSSIAPRMPTGPWIVVMISLFFFGSILFSPSRGVVARMIRQARRQRQVLLENVLRTIYKLGEKLQQPSAIEPLDIMKYRDISMVQLDRVLENLVGLGYLHRAGSQVELTTLGYGEAKRLTRRHRLWELYLSQKIKIASDHVHADAEEIEHFITPELESELIHELDFPSEDPHGQVIPTANIRKGESHGD